MDQATYSGQRHASTSVKTPWRLPRSLDDALKGKELMDNRDPLTPGYRGCLGTRSRRNCRDIHTASPCDGHLELIETFPGLPFVHGSSEAIESGPRVLVCRIVLALSVCLYRFLYIFVG